MDYRLNLAGLSTPRAQHASGEAVERVERPSAVQTHERPAGRAFRGDMGRGGQPPRRIMSKKSRLVLLAFILSSMNSIASISSIG